ncbi:MAG TPA: SAM-dependent methyltransferase [Acetobacteraceae bacterium]|nr:SAM-dependent methyltransferase [Acetobacteraceae bacterium]
MIEGEPSRTALAAARHRAAHQVLEGGRVFSDPLALAILAADPAEAAAEAEAEPERRPMRFFIAARHRVAEDAVAAAAAAGVDQLVVLGAGLDTQAYRAPHGAAMTVFEVDHPATQAWKRDCLRAAAIPVPTSLRFVAVNFETDSLTERLAACGFDSERRAIFVWLGVVPYLTEAAIFATLFYVASLPGGAEIIFDYADPPSVWPETLRSMLQTRAAYVASLGEAWITYFEAAPLAARLRQLGFTSVEDLNPANLVRRFAPGTPAPAREHGGHVVRAWT